MPEAARDLTGSSLGGPGIAGPRLAGPNRAGADLTGPDPAGPDRAGPDPAGSDLAGSDRAGPSVTGANLAGAGLATGLSLGGPDLVGPAPAGSDLAGPDVAGPDLAGPDLVGPAPTGPDPAGSDLAGSDRAGPSVTGANLAGAGLVTGLSLGGPGPAAPGLAGPDVTGPSLAGRGLEAIFPLLPTAGPEGGIALYRAWIAANPGALQAFAAWFNLGVELSRIGRPAEAEAAYREVLRLNPRLDAASLNLGSALEAQGRRAEAMAAWECALQPLPHRVMLLNQRGRLLEEERRFAEAETCLRESLALDPDQPDVVQHWLHLRQKACIWPLYRGEIPGRSLAELALQSGPLGILALTDDPDLQRRSAAAWLSRKAPPAPRRLSPRGGYRHDRIRLGYLSADFCRHALSFLMAEVFERHDRSQFEVFGYCSSPEDGSEIRRRVIAGFDHHVPIGALSEEDAAARIRADEIDILVDLNGLTKGARLGALRWKPAPVQATYLGYIGSVPLPELDWLICDAHVVPPGLAHLYAPRPLPLAGLYQANDSRMPPLPAVSRAAEGLPDHAFVLCCFSHHYKITEAMFGRWMEILRRVPRAVLWLVEDTASSKANLLRHAMAAGIEPARLVFAPRTEPARYLARFTLADLFLDTTPYNAGTVASDALRMGLPLLTQSGRAFASRMAGSLLQAVGLEAGITADLDSYVARAVEFATQPGLLAEARRACARWAASIGDSEGFTRRLEEAYRRIRLNGC
ncbi:O-linked N-acetylglucosamine transferase family protein [Siccirubricoccus phaeus]|nr:tetratricopeptide repeat protein [Siccirubricoccus phaeus]